MTRLNQEAFIIGRRMAMRSRLPPSRTELVNGRIVKEYAFGGKRIVTINNETTIERFEQACERLEKEGA